MLNLLHAPLLRPHTPLHHAGSQPRMYLSPATLVIVPVTLIPHWQQQVRAPSRRALLQQGSCCCYCLHK